MKFLLATKKILEKIEMMITYHPFFKNMHNLKTVILEIFRNSKYIKMFKFQESFAKYKWVIMCMTYEQSCSL
jgi:hypothetical protein